MSSRAPGQPRTSPTLQQVARRAGVSIATASRVVTGAVPVSPDRRARVERAIADLGYVPDERARDLRRTTTRTVAILVPSLASPLHGEVFRLIHRALRREGATLLVFESDGEPAVERAAVEAALRAHARALVVATTAGLGPDALRRLRRRDVRVVYFGDRPPDPMQAAVCVDDHGGARLLTEHLLGLGHRRIALLCGALDGSCGIDRRDGYLAALAAAGVPDEGALIAGRGWTLDDGRAAARAVLASSVRPTAILAAHPVLAAGALVELREHGLGVPEDVSLASFFDSDHIRYVAPGITCLTGMSENMADAIVHAIDRRDVGRIDVPLAPALRGSTAPPRLSP